MFTATGPESYKEADGAVRRCRFLVGKNWKTGDTDLLFVKTGLWTLPSGLHTHVTFSRSLPQTGFRKEQIKQPSHPPPQGEEGRGRGGMQTSLSRHRPHTSWVPGSQGQPVYMCSGPSGSTDHTGGTCKVIRSYFCAGTFNLARKIGQTNGQTDRDTRTHSSM